MTKKPNENDVVFIQALAELLSAQDLTEIEVNRHYGEDDSLNVRISKTQNVVQMAAPVAMAAPAAVCVSGVCTHSRLTLSSSATPISRSLVSTVRRHEAGGQ